METWTKLHWNLSQTFSRFLLRLSINFTLSAFILDAQDHFTLSFEKLHGGMTNRELIMFLNEFQKRNMNQKICLLRKSWIETISHLYSALSFTSYFTLFHVSTQPIPSLKGLFRLLQVWASSSMYKSFTPLVLISSPGYLPSLLMPILPGLWYVLW